LGEASQVVTFNTSGKSNLLSVKRKKSQFSPYAATDYPQQVLIVGAEGDSYLGSSLDINQNLDIAEPGPTVVDAIGRTAYWYSPSMNRIYSRSLNPGSVNTAALNVSIYNYS
jgi:hypothetical protein